MTLGVLLLASATARTAHAAETTLTVLHDFANGGGGSQPFGRLASDGKGNFYGTTLFGGKSDTGVVYKVSSVGEFGLVYEFGSSSLMPAYTHAGVTIGDDGTLYGTTPTGGKNSGGTLFKLLTDGTLTVLHDFVFNQNGIPGTEGYNPVGELAFSGSVLYGATTVGGNQDTGSTFAYALTQDVFTTYTTFSPANADGTNAGGSRPGGGVVVTGEGIYGVAYRGGLSAQGTLFRFTGVGIPLVIRNFTGVDGANPLAAPVVGSDGNIYGTTPNGGANLTGSVYRYTPGGDFVTLYSFPAVDANSRNDLGKTPASALTLGSDGSLYGTTNAGGANGQGTLYKITPGGVPTLLYTFSVGDGLNPGSGVVFGPDGNLYGTFVRNAIKVPVGEGNVYKVTFPAEITSAGTALATVGKPFSYQITATHGVFPSYQISGVPPGLNFNDKTGLLSGTPSQAGGYTLNYSVVNEAGPVSSTLNLTVQPDLPNATIEATTPSVQVGSGLKGVVTVKLSAPQAQDTVVSYVVKGSAVNGADYVLLKGTKKIKAGKTSKAIKIIPQGNLGGAKKKVVKVSLATGNGYTADATAQVKVKILAGP